jgi:hypothetical protein
VQNQLRRRHRRLDPGKNMLKQLFCAQKETSKSSKGREKLQTYLKSRNLVRSLHKSVIQAPSQVQKNTHTHAKNSSLTRIHTKLLALLVDCVFTSTCSSFHLHLYLSPVYMARERHLVVQMRHGLLKFEIMLIFLIKKRHPTKMKYGTYGFY